MRAVVIAIIFTAFVCAGSLALRLPQRIGWFSSPSAESAAASFDWPPRLGESYPNVALVDQTGATTRLADFRGKVILVELIGTPCGACQAYAGAHTAGPFRGGKVQRNLEAIDVYAKRYGKFDLSDDRLVFVQVLLFDDKHQAPTAADARAWAEHFGMDRSKNRVVLAGTADLATRQSYDMIPGFHLIDRDFKLVRDSSGHKPVHNLYTNLLPAAGELLKISR